MTYAFSRDDVEAALLPAYRALGVMPDNPFAVLDQDGVGELIRHRLPRVPGGEAGDQARCLRRARRPPPSAAFLVHLGVDSVSCSPFRVPMARLGVAQALLACGRVQINDISFDFDDARTGRTAAPMPARSPTSTPPPVDEALVLHALRVRGWVTPAGFANTLGSYPVRHPRPTHRGRSGAPSRGPRHVRPAAPRQGPARRASRRVGLRRRPVRAVRVLRPVPRAERRVQTAVHGLADAQRRTQRSYRRRPRSPLHRPARRAHARFRPCHRRSGRDLPADGPVLGSPARGRRLRRSRARTTGSPG